MNSSQKFLTIDFQTQQIKNARDECVNKYKEHVLNYTASETKNSYCPAIWDGILCWNRTEPGTILSQPCPSFIAGFNGINNATKECGTNGKWFKNVNININSTHWTNFTQCSSSQDAKVLEEIPKINTTLIEEYLPILKTISKIGYSISLSTLIIAFIIMISFKKLHCARNKLHMHLFASFIFRALMSLLKYILFVEGVGLQSDILINNGEKFFFTERESNNWGCKFFTSMWQYFITANYSWILMEGLYLHNLVLFALFSDSNNSILYYILLGWGLPLLVVGPWIISRINLDDTFCWTTHDQPSLFLIIRIPTMISILINLVLFINIARVLLLKLSSPVTEEAQRFRRWARSTLVLVPLFGVHYAAFLGMSSAINVNETVELIWLFCDQLFACFQGFFVAILYCFLNGEVRAELSPKIKSILSKCLSTPCCQYFFNCGDFSRSLRGRASVCTTLSCSSLYNSGVTHKFQNRKKWNASQQSMKHKNFMSQEKIDECHNCEAILHKTCHDPTHWNQHNQNLCNSSTCMKCTGANCFCANSIVPVTEMTACLDHQDDYKHDLDLEMITMDHNNT